MFKLGKAPARAERPKLQLKNYLDLSTLPRPPATFGYDYMVVSPWGMLGNDAVGDCVEAGAAHETMLWNAEVGTQIQFTDAGVVSDYSAATGYNPADPATDRGTDMVAYAQYRQNIGVVDSAGQRHKIGAYADLTPGDVNELLVAMYLFGAVGLGIRFPQSAMDQFNAGEPWTVEPGSPIIGGHYVPCVHRQRAPDGHWRTRIITWGAEQQMTDGFVQTYMDEGLVYFSEEFLKNGLTINGFNKTQLLADLKQL